MIEKTQWSRFIDATSGGAFNSAIAEAVGADPATIGRWRAGTVEPKPRQVVSYARAFGQSPIAALIAAGYLIAEEVDLPTTPRRYTLDDFSSVELAEELVERLASEEGYRTEVRRGEPSLATIEDGDLIPFRGVGGSSEDVPRAAKTKGRDRGGDDGEG